MNDVTHLGIQDIPMLSNIPNLVYLAPTTKEEYLAMLDYSISQQEHPVAIKLPGGAVKHSASTVENYTFEKNYEVSVQGNEVAILGLGTFYELGEQTAKYLTEQTGICPTVIKPYCISEVSETLLDELKQKHSIVVTIEDGILDGGFGETIARYYGDSAVKVLNYGLKKEFIDRYDVADVLKENHLTAEQIVEDVKKLLSR